MSYPCLHPLCIKKSDRVGNDPDYMHCECAGCHYMCWDFSHNKFHYCASCDVRVCPNCVNKIGILVDNLYFCSACISLREDRAILNYIPNLNNKNDK